MTVEELVFLHQLDNLTVVCGIDKCLSIKSVVHVGAHKLHPALLNHLESFALGAFAIESGQRKDIDLEIDTHILQMLEFRRSTAIIGVTLGMGKDNLVILHLQVEHHRYRRGILQQRL